MQGVGFQRVYGAKTKTQIKGHSKATLYSSTCPSLLHAEEHCAFFCPCQTLLAFSLSPLGPALLKSWHVDPSGTDRVGRFLFCSCSDLIWAWYWPTNVLLLELFCKITLDSNSILVTSGRGLKAKDKAFAF